MYKDGFLINTQILFSNFFEIFHELQLLCKCSKNDFFIFEVFDENIDHQFSSVILLHSTRLTSDSFPLSRSQFDRKSVFFFTATWKPAAIYFISRKRIFFCTRYSQRLCILISFEPNLATRRCNEFRFVRKKLPIARKSPQIWRWK